MNPARETPPPTEMLKALGHPLRRRILRAMSDLATASPTQLAEILDAPLAGVAYHTRILGRHGAVHLVDTRQVRGAREHFYRATAKAAWVHSVLEACHPEDEGEATAPRR